MRSRTALKVGRLATVLLFRKIDAHKGWSNIEASSALVNCDGEGLAAWIEFFKIATSLVVHDGCLTGEITAIHRYDLCLFSFSRVRVVDGNGAISFVDFNAIHLLKGLCVGAKLHFVIS